MLQLLEQRIKTDGRVRPGNILIVDSFLNHQMDVALFNEMGRETKRIYQDCEVTKILTIESSGIGIACVTAQFFDCPVVFAKKNKTKNIADDVFRSVAKSFTHGGEYDIIVNRRYLSEGDRVLLIDDFLAEGNAMVALIDICRQAGAVPVGCTCAIEKGFQHGADRIRALGVPVNSLAVVRSMEDGDIVFG